MAVEMKKTYKGYSGKVFLPPDQINYIAKYYRGLNLNLRLSLIEDDPVKTQICSTCDCCKELQSKQGQYSQVRHQRPRLIPNIQWGISPQEMMLLNTVTQGIPGPAPLSVGECPSCSTATSSQSQLISKKKK